MVLVAAEPVFHLIGYPEEIFCKASICPHVLDNIGCLVCLSFY